MAVGRRISRSKVRSVLIKGAVGLLAVVTPLVVLPATSQAAPSLTIAQAEAQLQVLEDQQSAAVEQYNQGQIALTNAQRAAATAASSVDRQQKKVDDAAAQLTGLARMAYMTGGVDPVTGLLSGQGASSVINRVGNLDQIARVRSAQATELKAEQTSLKALQITNKQKLDAATAAAKNLESSKTQVDALIAKQEAVINSLQESARKALLAKQAAERAAAAKEAANARAAASNLVRSAGQGGPVPAASSAMIQTVLNAAYSQLGKPYRYAGAGPDSYDCSGLTMWAFAKAGISLPHSSQAQFGIGRRVARSDLQPGDLVFYNEGGTIGHVGIYVGGGNMIDANHTGGWVGVRPLYDGYAGATRL